MLRLTTFATRATLVAVSTAVHAAVLLAPTGHPRVPEGPGSDAVEIDVLPAPVQVVDPSEPAPASPHAGGVPWHTHTHPYPVPASHDWTPHDPNLVHAFAAPAPSPAAAPSVLAEDEHDAHVHDDTPHFTIAIGTGGPDAYGPVAAAGTAKPAEADAGPVAEATVDSRATLVRGVPPSYPPPARAEGVEGSVRLELVVSPGGSVESARVVRGIGHGLDEAAVDAARRFAFAPAIKAGRAVRVRMGWSVDFRLQ